MNVRSRLSLLVVQILIFSLLTALLGRLFYLQIAAGGTDTGSNINGIPVSLLKVKSHSTVSTDTLASANK